MRKTWTSGNSSKRLIVLVAMPDSRRIYRWESWKEYILLTEHRCEVVTEVLDCRYPSDSVKTHGFHDHAKPNNVYLDNNNTSVCMPRSPIFFYVATVNAAWGILSSYMCGGTCFCERSNVVLSASVSVRSRSDQTTVRRKKHGNHIWHMTVPSTGRNDVLSEYLLFDLDIAPFSI